MSSVDDDEDVDSEEEEEEEEEEVFSLSFSPSAFHFHLLFIFFELFLSHRAPRRSVVVVRMTLGRDRTVQRKLKAKRNKRMRSILTAQIWLARTDGIFFPLLLPPSPLFLISL